MYRFKKLLQLIEGRKPDVLLHLGDGVQHGWSEREWLKDFIWPLQDAGLVPAVPMLMARGNHDVDGHAAVEFAPSMRTRVCLSSSVAFPVRPAGNDAFEREGKRGDQTNELCEIGVACGRAARRW